MKSTYHMVRVCCACKKVIGTKPCSDPAMHKSETHGYCAPCADATLQEVSALTARHLPVIMAAVAAEMGGVLV